MPSKHGLKADERTHSRKLRRVTASIVLHVICCCLYEPLQGNPVHAVNDTQCEKVYLLDIACESRTYVCRPLCKLTALWQTA